MAVCSTPIEAYHQTLVNEREPGDSGRISAPGRPVVNQQCIAPPFDSQPSQFAETSPADLGEIAAHQSHRIFCRRRALENGFPIGWSASRVLICTRMTTITVRSLGSLNLRSTLDELT